MGYIGGYDLHLYCDAKNCTMPHNLQNQFSGHSKATCSKSAKLAGWKISNIKKGDIGSGYVLCPFCSGKK